MHEERPCLRCGYDLTGLPVRGGCPECGNSYNLKTGQGVAADADSGHRRGERIMARVRTIFLLASIVAVMGCSGLLSWLVYDPGDNRWLKPLALGAVVCVVLLMAAILSYFNEREI